MRYIKRFSHLILFVIIFSSAGKLAAQTDVFQFLDNTTYKIIEVHPSSTDPAITYWDTAHVAYYDPAISNNKLMLWLTGTNGTTYNIPRDFFVTALEQGYRIIALSFISVPAVARICRGDFLDNNTDCAAEFRRMRIYGDNGFSMIPDQPQDAIIPRFVKLLQYLSKTDPDGNWQQYLDEGTNKPQWSKIAISGQSQGGGMGQFIAQYENIASVISFSGGWDYSNSAKKIADWYFNENVTPLENWYATYNTNENAANSIKEICIALKIPPDQVFALDKPLRNDSSLAGKSNPYHGDGLHNSAYRPVWIEMLGSGF